jgi:hypothetical protein
MSTAGTFILKNTPIGVYTAPAVNGIMASFKGIQTLL